MDRKEFIKQLGLGSLLIPLAVSCGNSPEEIPTGECALTPSETTGPFPTRNPSGLVLSDIRADRAGVGLEVLITIQNKNRNCAVMEGAIVDIWHCDKDGYYSEYGGSGMQTVNLQARHFCRGRQATNADGIASFLSIFPGWYPGRAPHIHVQVFDPSGKSLLVTQIAFPTNICDTVYTASNGVYTKGKQDTSNMRDNIFANSLSKEMAVLTGNMNEGYKLSHTIVVIG